MVVDRPPSLPKGNSGGSMFASGSSGGGSGSQGAYGEDDDGYRKTTLTKRWSDATKITMSYFQGDIVPITTKSNILRVQKFSVIYFIFMTLLIFVHSFIIPATMPDAHARNYGGFHPRTWHGGVGSYIIMSILMIVPCIRFCMLGSEAQFYEYVFLLGITEILIYIFVSVWWSHGMPALAVLLISNAINMIVSQLFWKKKFRKVVSDFKEIVKPGDNGLFDYQHVDTTQTSSFPGWSQFMLEWRKVMGFKKTKTLPDMYDERCGVFSLKKGQMSHSKSMTLAYQQAMDPSQQTVPWNHSPGEMSSLSVFGTLDGVLQTFVSNALYALVGLWLGRELCVQWQYGWYAVGAASALAILFGVSVYTALTWLEDGLGVAVAEKEWLAHDIVAHAGQREGMLYDSLDMTAQQKQMMLDEDLPMFAWTAKDIEFMQHGHLNLVNLWLSVGGVACFIGESYLAKVWWNVAHQCKCMVEANTSFEFRYFYDAKWRVLRCGTVVRSLEILMLSVISTMYFGRYYTSNVWLPVPVLACIGASCFVAGVLKMLEAMQFIFSILSNKSTMRTSYVSEWVAVVAMIFVLINLSVWLYMLPIMKSWNLPIGTCHNWFNLEVFPSACDRFYHAAQ